MLLKPRSIGLVIAVVAIIAVVATVLVSSSQPTGPSQSIALASIKSSGVSGTVTLTDVGGGRTRIEVQVDPAGNLDMPSHVHPGICGEIIPQPRFPLENVKSGHASTVIPVSLAELMVGTMAVTLHQSNDNLKTTVACGTLAAA
jgi:hypothetical protein